MVFWRLFSMPSGKSCRSATSFEIFQFGDFVVSATNFEMFRFGEIWRMRHSKAANIQFISLDARGVVSFPELESEKVRF